MSAISSTQTRKNLGANIAYFIVNIVIGIYLTPFFIESLGIAAYALVPLATSMIGYVGLLTNSLNSAVSRHLTIDMQRSDIEQANRTFNSAFFGVSKIILIMVPIVLIISFFAPSLFGASSENSMDATLLFVGIGLAFLIRSWSSSFTVTLYASNRLDLLNMVNFINIIVQISLIFISFNISSPSLTSIGISYLIGAIVATIMTIALYRKMNQRLSIKLGYFDGKKFREMAQMGGWIIINDFGALLLLNIDLIVVNYMYGNAVGGEYAIAYQWVGLLRGLASTFISIIGPIILLSYANGQRDRIISLSKGAVKLTSIGIALPVGLLCGFSPIVLSLWVGNEYVGLAPLMILLTSHLVINTAVIPLFQINVAFNKVRLPAIITLVTGVGNVVLAFTFAVSLEWGIYGVATAGLISMTLKNIVFTPIYSSIVLGVPKRTFYPAVMPGAIAIICIATLSFILSFFISIDSLVTLILISGVIAMGYILFSWKALLNESERSIMSQKTRSF